jgi:hypothetical protein
LPPRSSRSPRCTLTPAIWPIQAPRLLLAIIREHVDAVDYLVLADCVLLADSPAELHLISDDRIERIAQDARQATRQEPTGSPEHSRLMRQLVTQRQQLRNQPGGYRVAASDPEAASHALTGSWTAGQIRRAALLTDGASRLVDQFALADWPELLDLLAAAGPGSVIRQVRRAEDDDPRGERWHRHKRSDDQPRPPS